MIMSFKQKKIQIEPRIKLNYNIIKQLNDEKQFLNKYEILTE